MTRPAKHLTQLAGVLVLLYLLACVYMWATQGQKIFEPTALLQTTPDRDGMAYQEVRIPSGTGAAQGELYGWWIAAEPASAPTLLYLHGNFRNISHNVEHAMRLHSLGYNLLLVDYRGYGKSSGGPPSEAKMYEDAAALWNYLIKQRALTPQQTFIYGHSLGSAVAIDLALHHPDAAGLIAESAFTSMAAMGKINYGYLPIDWLLNQRFDSLDKINKLKIPALFIHGTWDMKIPYQMSQQLFDQAPQPKHLTLIEGGEHSNSSGVAWLEYRDAINTFVRKYSH
ncbi:MAG: alpha/beta fold hydrolase [Gallionellaceae bacterium]|nr:alpha/beta fold hydrolase [Gallionellaceae bacterium]